MWTAPRAESQVKRRERDRDYFIVEKMDRRMNRPTYVLRVSHMSYQSLGGFNDWWSLRSKVLLLQSIRLVLKDSELNLQFEWMKNVTCHKRVIYEENQLTFEIVCIDCRLLEFDKIYIIDIIDVETASIYYVSK